MYITTISLSFVLIGIGIAALIAFVYFKLLVISSSDKSKRRTKIIGNMKNPDSWRHKNNNMSYVSLFWAVISIGLFAYIKFYYKAPLVPVWYLFIYVAVLFISYSFFGIRKEEIA